MLGPRKAGPVNQMWKAARIAFDTKVKLPVRNAARTAEKRSASNAAAYEKQKKSEKEQAAARRKSKHEAYHSRVRDVLQANKAAQPLGDVDAATGACTCPKHIFCAKCPAEKYAQAKRTVEATELLFHDATNVGCGMELADADLDDLIEKCVKVTDARKIELQLTADDIERICENYRSDPTYVLKYFNEVGTEVR